MRIWTMALLAVTSCAGEAELRELSDGGARDSGLESSCIVEPSGAFAPCWTSASPAELWVGCEVAPAPECWEAPEGRGWCCPQGDNHNG